MHSSGSFLRTVIERVRAYMDEPETQGKYGDDFLVRHVIMPSMVDVWSRLRMTMDNPVLLSYSIDVTSDVTSYQLPPCIGEIWRVGSYDSTGHMLLDWVPENYWHPSGPGWKIEGNILEFLPNPPASATWQVDYSHNGDVICHLGTDGNLTTSTSFTLGSTISLGEKDRRQNAYAGQMLRLIPASGGVIEERVIDTHNSSTGVVTVRTAFATATGSGKVYEIAPAGSQPLCEAIAVRCAMKLATYRKSTSQTFMAQLLFEYKSAVKSITDNLNSLQMRTGKSWHKLTVDNPNLSFFA